MSAPFWELKSTDYLDQEVYLDEKPGVYFETPAAWDFEVRSIQSEYLPLTALCGRVVRAYPDFFWHGNMPIASDRFRKILLELGGLKVEFLPVTLLSKKKTLVDGNPYWYIHMLEHVNCIDYAQSELEFWKPESRLVKSVRRLVFDLESLGMRNLFMPFGLRVLFASDELKRKIDSDGLLIGVSGSDHLRIGC